MGARRVIGLILTMAGIVLAMAGVHGLVNQSKAVSSYKELALAIVDDHNDDEGVPNIDWASLLSENPHVVAWCRVEGTDIDLPVCRATDNDPGFWLTHDLWGQESPAGTPYIDHRASASSQHVLCYGHHLTGTGGMFSDLYHCHDQATFDQVLVGDLLWSTPDGQTTRLHPLCASVIDKDYAGIQRFDFANVTNFRQWLGESLGRSSARNDSAAALAANATGAITLVTCASDLGGQRERTVVTFIT